MALHLPAATSPLRELFAVADLAKLGDIAAVRQLPTWREAVHTGRTFLAGCQSARAVNTLALRADGSLRLVKVTRLAARDLWNFGKVAP